jgi:hypothetical protein
MKNKIQKKKNGEWSMKGLSDKAKTDLWSMRKRYTDENIIPVYDEETDDIFFSTADKININSGGCEVIYN